MTKRNSREKDAAAAVISHLSSGDSSRLKAKKTAKEREIWEMPSFKPLDCLWHAQKRSAP